MKKSVNELAAEIVEAGEGAGRGWSVVIGEKMRGVVRSGEYSAVEIGEMMIEIERLIAYVNAWREKNNARPVGE